MMVGQSSENNLIDPKIEAEIKREKSFLQLSKSGYLGNERIIAKETKSDKHLGAFNVNSKKKIPSNNYVLKLKNFVKLHIRIGVVADDKKKDIVVKIYNVHNKN